MIWNGHLNKSSIEPYLFGSSDSTFGLVTYDTQVKRWLPVSRRQVAPDGLSYAYAEWLYPPPLDNCRHGCVPDPTGGRIHITDVRSGQDRIAYSFTAWPEYQIVSFAPPYVYLDGQCNGDYAGCHQLSRLDVQTGVLLLVTDQTGQQWRIDGHYVWFETVDYTQLRRLDMSKGTTETWLNKVASDSMELIGVDGSGTPWVALASIVPSALLRVPSAGKADQVFAAAGPYSDLVSDRQGTWFAVVDNVSETPGLHLYTKAGAVVDISSLPLLPV